MIYITKCVVYRDLLFTDSIQVNASYERLKGAINIAHGTIIVNYLTCIQYLTDIKDDIIPVNT